MKFRILSSFINTRNNYSILRWPLFVFSILIIVVAVLLFVSFQSPTWFTFQGGQIQKDSTIQTISYGSFGLWEQCLGEQLQQCEILNRRTRHQGFDVVLILTSCVLFLICISIFPSWAATILLFYNINNNYIRYIVTMLWILLCLVLTFTCLLVSMLVIVGTTKYYSPGKFMSKRHILVYRIGPGMDCAFAATIFSVIELIIIICSLIAHKFIEMKLQEEEKELYRLLTEDERNPNWHQLIRIPRDMTLSDDEFSQEPPPYND